MMTFSSECKRSLEYLVNDILTDHWTNRSTDVVSVDEIIKKIHKRNAYRDLKAVVYVAFADNKIKPGDDVGWPLKEIATWGAKIKARNDNAWVIEVPDPCETSISDGNQN